MLGQSVLWDLGRFMVLYDVKDLTNDLMYDILEKHARNSKFIDVGLHLVRKQAEIKSQVLSCTTVSSIKVKI